MPSKIPLSLSDGGTAGALLRSMDWSATPVGPIDKWPNSLLCAVGMLLHSRHPMFLWWGPELIQFYNDAYIPSFGRGKHPAALGQRGRDCWQEIWPVIWPQIHDVMTGGKASWNEDELVPIARNERLEEVYWTYGYSPVFDDCGAVGGTLVVCTETTARVLAARRAHFVRRLNEQLSLCDELNEIVATARRLSAAMKLDIPYLLTYGRSGDRWQLTGSSNLSAVALPNVDARVVAALCADISGQDKLRHLDVRADAVDAPWPEPSEHAVIVTPAAEGLDTFVFGVSPRLQLDDSYAEFFQQLVAQVDLAAARLQAFRIRAAIDSERRNLLLQAPVATAIVTGPDHVFELANPLYRQIVGRDVIGKAYLEAFPEVRGTPLAKILDDVYATGEPFVAEEYLIPLDRDGTGAPQDCYYKFNLEPIRDAQGLAYGMMAVAADITEQVQSRITLEKANLEREKLLVQLRAANQTKDDFLATVSHELRTPLTSILGWSRLLRETGDPARVQKGLAAIERNAKSQAQLIEDILDVSRIVSGKMRMNMRRVDVGAVVNAAVETVRPTANAKRIRFVVAIEPDVGSLVADEDRLQQIIWNLLSNALKFTRELGEVNVRAARESSRVIISVRDSGKGILPAFLPHIFDRFRQDDTSTTKQHAGLGLGLAIVRHLVELHGGSVEARSEGEGRGATFEVALPIRAVEPRDENGSELAPASPSTPQHFGARRGRLSELRILVVDDQADARDLVATVLEDAGAHVTQADSVAAALAALSRDEFSVLVSDIAMPREDGYTLLHRLRASEAAEPLRSLPALALTAYARAEDRQAALTAGFQEHVAKPIDPATWWTWWRAWLAAELGLSDRRDLRKCFVLGHLQRATGLSRV